MIDVPQPEELFTRAADNWQAEGWLTQLGWITLQARRADCSSPSAAALHDDHFHKRLLPFGERRFVTVSGIDLVFEDARDRIQTLPLR
jgi:hypothetical protein